MQGFDPPDEMHLLRIIWSPDDVINGQVLPTAFKKSDLYGVERCVSVDRVDLLVPAVARNTAARQKMKSNPEKSILREEAYSTRIVTGVVRDMLDDVGERPLAVHSSPILSDDPTFDNPAHCLIANISGKKHKNYLLGLQTKLASLTFDTKHLEVALVEIERKDAKS
jgi:hypothetical protein